MMIFWVSIIFFVVAAAVLVVWRKELTEVQAMMLGARMHPGCAVVEAITLLVLAIIFYLGLRSGAFG
jgi:hypothetical protein